MSAVRISPHQREVLNYLSKGAVFSPEKARSVPDFDEVSANKLT